MNVTDRDLDHLTHLNIDGDRVKMQPRQLAAFRNLTMRQRRLVLAVLAGNATRDAAKASDMTYAHALRILGDSDHATTKLIDSFNFERINDAIMSRDELLARLSDMGRTDISDVVDWHNEGQLFDMETNEIIDKETTFTVKPAHKMTAAARGSIKRIRQTKYGLDVELHDGRSAMVDLARIQGIDAPRKIDHTSTDGSMTPQPGLDVSKLSDEALREIMEAADENEE